MRFKTLLKIAAVSLTLNACNTPQTIPDGLIGAVECDLTIPLKCGPVACTQVHTIYTGLAPVHLNAPTCGQALIGSVFMDGIYFSKMIGIVDNFCTQDGDCTYQQAQDAAALKEVMIRARDGK